MHLHHWGVTCRHLSAQGNREVMGQNYGDPPPVTAALLLLCCTTCSKQDVNFRPTFREFFFSQSQQWKLCPWSPTNLWRYQNYRETRHLWQPRLLLLQCRQLHIWRIPFWSIPVTAYCLQPNVSGCWETCRVRARLQNEGIMAIIKLITIIWW